MKPRHQVSRAAIELIKRFEGYRQRAAQLPDGRWTIGYGHTLTAREGAEVSEKDAEALLMYDLIQVAHVVNENVYSPLTQNQFDALCAFAFNIGTENFRRSSVLRRINEGHLLQAACAMELWRKAEFEGEHIVVDALVRRRASEKTLFLTPADGWVPAPSPILRPGVDADALGVVPRQTPTALRTVTDGDQVRVIRDEPPVPPPVPPTEAEEPGPAQAAAASITSRLSTIFAEPASQPAVPAEPERVSAVEAQSEEVAEPVQPAPTEPQSDRPPLTVVYPSAPVIEAAPAEPVAAHSEPVSDTQAAPADQPEESPAADAPEAAQTFDASTVAEPAVVETEPAVEAEAEPRAPASSNEPAPEPAEAVAPQEGASTELAQADFTLTPPEPDEAPAGLTVIAAQAVSEASTEANDTEPGLFDRVMSDVGPLDAPQPRAADLVAFDEALEAGAPSELRAPTPVSGLAWLGGVAVLGLALFGGGLYWGLNARADGDGGPFSPLVVSWLAGILGLLLVVFALYLYVERSSRDDEVDPEG